MLREGAVRKLKQGEHALCENNTFSITKSNKDPRFILNGKPGNNFVDVPRFTIPSIFSVLKKPAKWAMKFDLTNAFLHFKLHPELQKYFCFRDSTGELYTW